MRTTTIHFVDMHPAPSDLRAEALEGLQASPKYLHPKFFYDRAGSELFERITHTPEYYPTRTEIALLEEHASEIATRFGPSPLVIELGSGASRKIRILLDALAGKPARYLALDISRDHLIDSAEALADAYPNLDVWAVCADYTRPLPLPAEALEGAGRRVAFFPGSTIGNFSAAEAELFLRSMARMVGKGGAMLLGADLVKDPAVLDAAYNDEAGLTAEFNLNLLRRLNRETGAGFDLSAFRHKAFYDAAKGRIEMHLVSLVDQTVDVAGHPIRFRAGETIHTESSHKFTLEGVRALASRCGFEPVDVWTDPAGYFSLHWLEAR
ncbi:MAG: L-histidine N(alpha)-methyltransferase [Bryobacterales bacterium]|nr:L-histidine N(alpha)-methyltransferase [Acidobacteriota bacterium]MCB9383422.1 L-histidine N(alpha)-methyltransferase [Bryobacterales bacterium]